MHERDLGTDLAIEILNQAINISKIWTGFKIYVLNADELHVSRLCQSLCENHSCVINDGKIE
jgi:hypothetical protein